jgi:hypothetical protein
MVGSSSDNRAAVRGAPMVTSTGLDWKIGAILPIALGFARFSIRVRNCKVEVVHRLGRLKMAKTLSILLASAACATVGLAQRSSRSSRDGRRGLCFGFE